MTHNILTRWRDLLQPGGFIQGWHIQIGMGGLLAIHTQPPFKKVTLISNAEAELSDDTQIRELILGRIPWKATPSSSPDKPACTPAGRLPGQREPSPASEPQAQK